MSPLYVRGVNSAAAASSAAAPSIDYGALSSSIMSANAAANAFNSQEAQKNRDFQLYMSNTAHQREMADLAAAGLNPILAARQGATTAAGSAASASDASGAIAGLLGQIVSAQSAQAIANRNNATAQLIEKMRESHDSFIHQNYPISPFVLAGSLLNNPALQRFANSAASNSSVAKAIQLFFNPWQAIPGWNDAKDAISAFFRKHVSINR